VTDTNPAQLTNYHFVLASTSPRRRELLGILGIPLTVVSPGAATPQGQVDETPLPNEQPAALVQRLSRAKAQTVIDNLALHLPHLNPTQQQKTVVIAADTVVVLKEQILGKPTSPAEATQMLEALRQQPHYVYSGLTAARLAQKPNQATVTTRLHQSKVWMRPYTNAQIARYVAGGSPLDKAGAYGIQDQPFAPVARLEGCFSSVMGLPLAELAAALAQLGVSLPNIATACSRYTGTLCCQTNPAHL